MSDSQPESVLWPFEAPVLDQGQIGSCTGNAVTQFVNTEYARKISGRTAFLDEADAVKVYELATEIDQFPGSYPTADTGSTGASACEAAIRLGYLSSYSCVGQTLVELLAALRLQPLIVQSNWTDNMMSPDPDGLIHTTGSVDGAHEYLLLGFDVRAQRFTFLNSWSDTWGVKGRFQMAFADFVNLLAEGDLSAVNAPKPVAALT